MKFIVKEDTKLLEFLFENIKNKSKNSIKNMLTTKLVKVNNNMVTRYDFSLKENDTVEIIKKINDEIDIIYEDSDLIVVDKPYGLLTISTEKEHDKTLYKYVSNYMKKINKNLKIFIVHRLDKDTSGIVVFAKNEKFKKLLQDNWNKIVTRKYYALVEGKMEKSSGTIKSYLKENSIHKTFSSNKGELAITEYKVLKIMENTLLEINIKTGKKNQIRVHLSDTGHPIIGDKKYGSKVLSDRLMLHAYSLSFINPMNKKEYLFKTNIPKKFITKIGKNN